MPTLQEIHQEHSNREGGYSANYYAFENDKGAIEVEFCSSCGILIYCRCCCEKNTWNEEGTILKCNLCGKDVT